MKIYGGRISGSCLKVGWTADSLDLATSAFLVGDKASLADVALVAYTRMAGEGGFDLASYPAVTAWIWRVEQVLKIT